MRLLADSSPRIVLVVGYSQRDDSQSTPPLEEGLTQAHEEKRDETLVANEGA
jgi:hypothetical protein